MYLEIIKNLDLERTLFLLCLDTYSPDILEEYKTWTEFYTRLCSTLFSTNPELQKRLQSLNKMKFKE